MEKIIKSSHKSDTNEFLIPIPHFSETKIPSAPEKNKKTIKHSIGLLSDDNLGKIHQRLESTEKKARKREAEVDQYERYIMKLRKECPELFKTKG